jgi:hypothetical protein
MADEKQDPPSATPELPRVRRRAPTIDLKATEVAVEPQSSATSESAAQPPEPGNTVSPEYSTEPPAYETSASTASPPPEPPQPSQKASAPPFIERSVIEAGFAGGLMALVVFGALWLGGMFSSPPDNAYDQRLALMETRLREAANRSAPGSEAKAIQELAARVGRMEAAPRSEGNGSAVRMEEAVKPLQATVADLARVAGDTATAVREARSHADAALVAADAARVAVEGSNVEALSNRITALESAWKALNEDVVKNLAAIGDKPLRSAVAAQALQGAVERGDAFTVELAAAKATGANAQTLAMLEPFATSGLPKPSVLARQLSDIAPAMLRAMAAPAPANGFLDRLQANAEKLVRIRPIDEAPGDDPAAVIGRAQAKAARSDFPGAVAELKALPANLRTPAEDWIRKVEARDAAVNASRRLVTDALAALGEASQ